MNHPVVSRCFESALPIPCGASMLRYIDAVSRSSSTGSSGLHCVHQASPPVEPLTCGGGARLLCRIPSVVRLRLRSLLPRRLPVLSADAKYDTITARIILRTADVAYDADHDADYGTDYIADHSDHRRRIRRRSRRRLRHGLYCRPLTSRTTPITT